MLRAPLTPARVDLEREVCCTSTNLLLEHPVGAGLGADLHQQSFQELSRAPSYADISIYSLQNWGFILHNFPLHGVDMFSNFFLLHDTGELLVLFSLSNKDKLSALGCFGNITHENKSQQSAHKAMANISNSVL